MGEDNRPPEPALPHPPTVFTAQVFDDPAAVIEATLALPLFRYTQRAEAQRTFGYSMVQRTDGRWTLREDAVLRSPSGPRRPPAEADEHWEALARITCPTLLVRAAESSALSRTKAERMVQTLPHGRLVEIPRSDHWVHGDNPTDYIMAIRALLLGEAG